METKVYLLENLDCANCAAKIEAKFRAHPHVSEATITFATMQLRLTAENPDELIPELTELGRTVEGELEVHPRERGAGHHAHHHEHHHDHDHCECDHEHHHDHCECGYEHHHDSCECGCEHHHEHCECGHDHEHTEQHPHAHGEDGEESLVPLLVGGGLLVAGLLTDRWELNWLTIGICLAAYVLLGWEVLVTAGKNLLRGHVFDENFLMSVATLGALAIGEFPEAVGVMLFYRVGEYFEHRAVERSRSQIMEAVDLRPETVLLVDGDGVTTIPAEDAQIGDLLLVRPGDRIPLDGVVVEGESRVDTAPITGEPVPVSVAPGDCVTSGCVNTTGRLTMRVEKTLESSMVTRILDSVENAAASKPKIDGFITRFARIYTPVVVGVALLTAVLPSIVTGDWNYWVYTALSFLVMSCPCALVLSVPLAFFSGIGRGSRQGILFKGGLSMEAMSRVKAVVMDKTGTLTRGDFRVQQVVGDPEILRLCASCEQQSSHPIARSVVEAAAEENLSLLPPEDLTEVPGKGIRGRVDGKTVLCGNASLLRDAGVNVAEAENVCGSVVYVAVDGACAGYLVVADTVKKGTAAAISRLKQQGYTTAMLTGDGENTAVAVAQATGVEQVYAGLLPHEKLERLRNIRGEVGPVMFVGDGINDAPVLAGADVGAAMGSGADAAIEAADVVFMTSGVDAIGESLEIARQTNRIAWQNVIFALTVKAIVMVLGLCGVASMWLAVFADSGVAMLCVLNSIRLLYRKQ